MEKTRQLIDEKTGRIEFIDTLRGFTILLMLWGHTTIPSGHYDVILSFHMPIFIILSGMTIKLNKYYQMSFKDFLIRLVKNYLIPYFFLNFITFPIQHLAYNYWGHGHRSIAKGFISIFIGNNKITDFQIAGPSWFIVTLFLSHLIFYFLVKITKKDKVQLFILCCICAIVSYLDKGQHRPWHYNVAFTGVMYLFIGNILISVIKEKELLIARRKWLYILLPILVGCISFRLNGQITLNSNKFGKSLILFYTQSLGFCIGLILLFLFLPKLRVFNFVGKNTLLYLSFTSQLIKIFHVFCPSPYDKNYFINFGVAILIFFIMIPLFMFVNKFCPYIVGKKRQLRSDILNNLIKTGVLLTCVICPIYYLANYNLILALCVSLSISLIMVPLINKFFPIIWNEEKA